MAAQGRKESEFREEEFPELKQQTDERTS